MPTEKPAAVAGGRSAATSPLLPLLLLAFLDALGFSLILPIAPSLMAHFTGGVTQASLPFGVLLSGYALATFLAAPVVGRISDAVGRRPILLTALLVVVLDYLVSATTGALWLLFAARIVAGLCGGSTSVVSAYLADITPADQRAQRFGLLWAALSVGFVIGPGLGGALAEWGGLRAPFWVAAGLAAVNLAWAVVGVPESLGREHRRPLTFAGAAPLLTFKVPPSVRRLLLASLLIQLSRSGLQGVFAIYAQFRLGWSMLQVGGALVLIGAAMTVVQAGLAGRFITRFGERRVLVGGLSVMALAYALLGVAGNSLVVYAAVLVWSLGSAYEPALQGLVSRTANASEQGQRQGALTSMNSLAWVFGPTAAAALFAAFTGPRAPVQAPGGAFLVGAILAAIAAGVSIERQVRPAVQGPVARLEPATDA